MKKKKAPKRKNYKVVSFDEKGQLKIPARYTRIIAALKNHPMCKK